MKRHSFRWESLAFGAFYAAIVGNWFAHEQNVTLPDKASLVIPIGLIVLGGIGIIATMRRKS